MRPNRFTYQALLFFGFMYSVVWVPHGLCTLALDRQYALESIGFIRPDDNVNGFFSEALSNVLNDYFGKQSRFLFTDLSKVDSLLTQSKIPYSKLITDSDILRQIMKSRHIDSLIRTRIKKQGSQYHFTLDWIHSTESETMSTESFTIDAVSAQGSLESAAFQSQFQSHLDILFDHLPFAGRVTGRDQDTVTVNLGSKDHLKKNDLLIIGTLEEVRKHPLLNTVLEWRTASIGKVRVEDVEKGIAFCKIVEEHSKEPIARYQKILQIQPAPEQIRRTASAAIQTETQFTDHNRNSLESVDQEPEERPKEETHKLGWVEMGLIGGSTSRQFNTLSGSGVSYGAQANSEFWLNQHWFSNLRLGYMAWNLSQNASQSSINSSLTSFKLNAGYAFHLYDHFEGPTGWVKLGYKSSSIQAATSLTALTGPMSFHTLFIGVGGELPFKDHWGLLADFTFKLITSVSQNWMTGVSTSGASDVELYFGGYYHLNPRFQIRLGLDILSLGANFSDGSSMTQTSVNFIPAFVYYL